MVNKIDTVCIFGLNVQQHTKNINLFRSFFPFFLLVARCCPLHFGTRGKNAKKTRHKNLFAKYLRFFFFFCLWQSLCPRCTVSLSGGFYKKCNNFLLRNNSIKSLLSSVIFLVFENVTSFSNLPHTLLLRVEFRGEFLPTKK